MNIPNNSAIVNLDLYNELVRFKTEVEQSCIPVRKYDGSYGQLDFYTKEKAIKEIACINQELIETDKHRLLRIEELCIENSGLKQQLEKIRELSWCEFRKFKKS